MKGRKMRGRKKRSICYANNNNFIGTIITLRMTKYREIVVVAKYYDKKYKINLEINYYYHYYSVTYHTRIFYL